MPGLLVCCALLLVHSRGVLDTAAAERAVIADPENLRVAADYRQLTIAAGAFDRAIDLLERLARRKDAGPNVQISLALAYIDKVPVSGDIRRLYLGRDAVNALTRAIERQPTVLAYYLRGVINLFYNNVIFKRTARGVEDLRHALALVTPETPALLASRIYASIGDGYWRLEDRARAREIWSEALAKFPGEAELTRRLDPDPEKVRWVVIDALNASARVDTTLHGMVP